MADNRKGSTVKNSGSARPKNITKNKAARGTAQSKNVVSIENRRFSSQTRSILLLAFAAVLTCLILMKNESIWLEVHKVLGGLFGFCAILWPLLLVYIAIMTALEKRIEGKIAGKLALSISAVVCVSTLVYVFSINSNHGTINYLSELAGLYAQGVNYRGAGLLSGVLGIPLVMLCGKLGAQVITVIVLTTLLMLLFGVSVKNIIIAAQKPAYRFRDAANTARERRAQQRAEYDIHTKDQAFYNNESYYPSNNSGNRRAFNADVSLDADERVKGKTKQVKKSKYENLKNAWDKMNSNSQYKAESEHRITDASKVAQLAMEKKRKPKKSSLGQLQPDPQTVPVEFDKVVDDMKGAADANGYCYPPIDLLMPVADNYSDNDSVVKELHDGGNKLLSTLESFGVRAKIMDISRGPSVTRFELQPAAGIKISKITNLADDIAMNLAAERVRIEAPIPGKAAIGIEVPNKIVSMVTMRELIGSRQFRGSKSKLAVVLGKDISGNIVITDLAKMPHLLIAGTTGSGKSVCVNSLLLSILFKASPEEVKMVLIDPKMVEFSKYKGVPHLLIPVVSDVKKAAGALNWAVSEMLNRYKTFAAYNVRDIGSYNRVVDTYKEKYKDIPSDTPEEDLPLTDSGLPIPRERMPKIVIAIDELADLMMASPTEVEESICRLAQMARAAGMHLVIATQRPSVNVITGVIKANIPSRIALKTSSQIDSRTILDLSGAERLLGRGDMLFAPIGCSKPLRVQGGYASDEEIENVTAFTKKSAQLDYDENVVEQIDKIASTEIQQGGKKNDSHAEENGDKDPMLEDAIKLVVEAGQASTSLLQRRLRLGYARAGRLIDEMEQMGIVGPHEGSKSRQVLMSHQDWLERNNILSE